MFASMAVSEIPDPATFEVELMRDNKKRVSKVQKATRVVSELTKTQFDIRRKLAEKVKVLEKETKKPLSKNLNDKSPKKDSHRKVSSEKQQVVHAKNDRKVSNPGVLDGGQSYTKMKPAGVTVKPLDKNIPVLPSKKLALDTSLDTKSQPVPSDKSQSIKKKPFKRRQHTNSAPAMSFSDLLKLADKNKNKTIKSYDEPVKVQIPKSDNRPLTQDEKDRRDRTNSKEYKDWLNSGMTKKLSAPSLDTNSTSKLKQSEVLLQKHVNVDSRIVKPTNLSETNGKSVPHLSNYKQVHKTTSKDTYKKETISNSRKGKTKLYMDVDIKTKSIPNSFRSNNSNGRTYSQLQQEYSKHCNKNIGSKSKEHIKPLNKNDSAIITSSTNSQASNPWDRIYSQIQTKKPAKRQRYHDLSDTGEDDLSDDDFICDDPIDEGAGNDDISSHIREIFNYDKRKYRLEDDDDRGMETSFTQQMREEAISSKVGKMEDLEDMQKELRRMQAKKARRKAENKERK